MPGFKKAGRGIKSSPVFFTEPWVEGKKSGVDGQTAKFIDFFVEFMGLGAVKVAVFMPDPEIVIACMIDTLAFKLNVKGDAHIS